ncbi:MAG: transporter substrate-binding domain-containing protein [Gammaproteobacteria bacterium]|jgi:polar amino acid transport system substrate-binding protein
MSRGLKLVLVAAAVTVAAGLAFWMAASLGPRNAHHGAEPTLERLVRTGRVRIGVAPRTPFARVHQDGSIDGASVDLARTILGQMGMKSVKLVSASGPGALIAKLHSGEIDLIAAGLEISPEHCRAVSFSSPVYVTRPALLTRRGNPLGLISLEGIAANPRARLGVPPHSHSLAYAIAANIPDERLMEVGTGQAAAALAGGRIDAYLDESLAIKKLLAAHPGAGLERADPFVLPKLRGVQVRHYHAFAFRPEDAPFRASFNQHLVAFIGSQAHLDMIRPYGLDAHDLSDRRNPDSVCTGEADH